jgi:hypothetical protein
VTGSAGSLPGRRLLRLGLVGSVLVVSIAGFSGWASGASPRLQGWWASTNPGGLPAEPPAAPDVPPDGLLVQAGPSGPSAYAALVYDLAAGETPARLTLQLASGAAPAPSAALVLCPLKAPAFTAEQGGPMGDAPAYDCKRTASASLDGASFTFPVAGWAVDGVLAVAVLPGDPSTRAALARPSEGSLSVSGGSAGSGAAVGSFAPGPDAAAGSGGAPAAATPALQGSVSAPVPAGGGVPAALVAAGAAQSPAALSQAAAASAATGVSAVTPAAASRRTGAPRRVLAVLIVAVVACTVVAWAFAGSGPVGPVTDQAAA